MLTEYIIHGHENTLLQAMIRTNPTNLILRKKQAISFIYVYHLHMFQNQEKLINSKDPNTGSICGGKGVN